MSARVAALTAALALGALLVVIVLGQPRGGGLTSLLAVMAGASLVIAWRARTQPPIHDGGRQRPAVRAAHAGRVVLLLLLLPTLVHFHAGGGRLGGDGVSYYVYVRSLVKDADLEFTNEYTHYELIDREDIRIPTRTGYRRSIFAVGPGLASIPFFVLGEAVGRAAGLVGANVDLGGYGPVHLNAVALGGLLYGFGAVWIIHELLRRHFRARVALLAAALVWGGTFLYWYMVHHPTMSHAPSACAAALVVWLWERGRTGRSVTGWAVLGLATGFAMCVRWQNGLLLLLPAWDLARHLVRERAAALPDVLRSGALLAAGTLLGVLPQMAAWKVIYGEWLLRYPPHGADFVRLQRPFVLETLFSARHGLLSWTPVFWLGFLGLVPLVRRRAPIALPMLLPLALMSYVNMSSGDWWAGGSFSNRRFDSLLPLFAFGFAASLDTLRRALVARPVRAVAAVALALLLWNVGVVAAVARGLVDTDRTVAFPEVVRAWGQTVADAAGSPPTWPASWLFAWREGRPPAQYDLLVGRYLFYRQNNMGGRVAVARAEDAALVAEGWSAPHEVEDRPVRSITGPARLFAPLDGPEDLRIVVRARPVDATIAVHVNGQPAGSLRLATDASGSAGALDVPAAFWRPDLNDVLLVPSAEMQVEHVDFERLGAPGPVHQARPR